MTLHVFNNPTGDRTADDGINVWVTEVPADYTDDDVKYNVEKWAADGDKTAQLALDLVKKHGPYGWVDMGRSQRNDRTVRVYLDK